MEREGIFSDSSGALSRLVQKGHNRMGTPGYAARGHSTAVDIAGKGLCFLRLILHRKISPLCTHTQSNLLLPLLQLVFEEIPWEALKGKKRAPGVDCNRWKLNMTESFTLF